jgi:GTP-binding protein EngB required for normal cell division
MSKEFIDFIKQFQNPNVEKYISIIEDIANKEKAEIVFVGEFANGKSSVLNALIGSEVLPTGIGPITSKITFIEKGNDNTAFCDNDSEKTFDINNANSEIEKIAKAYDDEKGNEDSDLHIKLRDFPFDDYVIVDTPGINDKNIERELITYEYAPRAEAMVFILDAGRGFTKYEADFFQDLSDLEKEKIFVVINKIDAYEELSDNDIQTMLDAQGISKSKAFVVSAKWALKAIKTNDEELLLKSNINQFKNALIEYVNGTDSRASVNNRRKKIIERIYELSKLEIDYRLQGLELDAQKIAARLEELSVELTKANGEQEFKRKDLEDKIKNTEAAITVSIQSLKKELKESYFSLTFTEQKKDFVNSGKLASIFENFRNDLSKNFEEFNIDLPNFDTKSLIADTFKKLGDAVGVLSAILNGPLVKILTDRLSTIPKIGPLLKAGTVFIEKLGITIAAGLKNVGEAIEPYLINLDNQINSAIENTEGAITEGFDKFKTTAEMQLNKTVEEIEAKISGYEMAKKQFDGEQQNIDAKIAETVNFKSILENLYKNQK